MEGPTETDWSLIHPLRTVQNKCLGTIAGACKMSNVQVLEHEASVAPLDLHLEMLAVDRVQRTGGSAGSRAVGETCKAIQYCRPTGSAPWTKGNIPARHMDRFRTRAESMQQQPYLAKSDRGRSKTATVSELEET